MEMKDDRWIVGKFRIEIDSTRGATKIAFWRFGEIDHLKRFPDGDVPTSRSVVSHLERSRREKTRMANVLRRVGSRDRSRPRNSKALGRKTNVSCVGYVERMYTIKTLKLESSRSQNECVVHRLGT
jgi:hypothetical protein